MIDNPGHMTKMATMPIYGKKPSQIFMETAESIAIKLVLPVTHFRRKGETCLILCLCPHIKLV